MATIKVRALQDDNRGLEWGRVVWGDRGQPFMFKFSPKGTADGAVVETEVGTMSADEITRLTALIEDVEGVVIPQNPKYDDVKSDADGDGVSDDETNYSWATSGKLYEVV